MKYFNGICGFKNLIIKIIITLRAVLTYPIIRTLIRVHLCVYKKTHLGKKITIFGVARLRHS